MNYFRDISTFGGCTAGPAAALENMAIIEDEDLLDNTAADGRADDRQSARCRTSTR
jgi:taurine-pyruvate aminotransferase